MNIYLLEANQTDYYFPPKYHGFLFEQLWDFSEPAKVFDLIEDDYQENSIFIMHNGDLICNLIPKATNVAKIRKIQNKKIIIDFTDKTFLHELAQHALKKQFKSFLEDAQFIPKNIYCIVQTKKDCEIIKKCLDMEVNTFYHDRWLCELNTYLIRQLFQNKKNYRTITNNLPRKKFSLFIRRFTDIRLHVVCELLAKNLLENFHYTFCGESTSAFEGTFTGGYKTETKILITNYINNLPDYFTPHKNKILDWANGIPYTSSPPKAFDYSDFFSINLGCYYNSSDITFVVETHVECLPGNGDFSSLTEKTYKAMLYMKPLIIFSQPNNLQYLRDCGYKTFSPFIDESYDKIQDTHERLRAIVNEIDRINNLPTNEYENLLKNCQNSIEHNYKLLLEEANKPICESLLIKNMKFV